MILRPNWAKAAHKYGALSIPIEPQALQFAPFSCSVGSLAPNRTSEAHSHSESELFVVLSGTGHFNLDGTSHAIRAGDFAYAPPFTLHHFNNSDGNTDLILGKLWWENRMESTSALDARYNALTGCAPNVLVTATPPTPNGDLHLGHLSGPYLRADAYTRFLRLREHHALYLTGVDDHQSYVQLKAHQLGKSADEVANDYGELMISTLSKADIRPDWIGQPRSSKTHRDLVSEMLVGLWERGELVSKNSLAPFCTSCNEFIFEAFVNGDCPHCGARTGGNACETCGLPNDCAELIASRCSRCKSEPVLRSYERLYFPLSRHRDSLLRYWNSVHMDGHLKALCKRMTGAELPDIAVTHLSSWGLPVPIAQFSSQTIYVWFEMAAGYIAATREALASVNHNHHRDDPWRSESWEIVQFFGFDNGYFHAVLFPALLSSFDQSIRLPTRFVTNEFYRLDGKKFSTSRNHAVWGGSFLSQHCADAVRLYLAYTGPETEQTNFTEEAFHEFLATELSGRWNQWLRTVCTAVDQAFDGRSPEPGLWTDEHICLLAQVRDIVTRAEHAYSARSFSLQSAARLLCELVRISHRAWASEAHLGDEETERAQKRTQVAVQLTSIRALAILSTPMMPAFGQFLWTQLGFSSPISPIGPWRAANELIQSGLQIGDLLFTPFEQWQ